MKTMKRALIALAALSAFPASAFAQGTTTEIATGNDFFDPDLVASDVGVESFHWAWDTPDRDHNVHEQGGVFSSGGLSPTGDFTITPSAGTFRYVCQAHGTFSSKGQPIGMAGQIEVRPTATPQGKRALVTWATEATDTGNRYDVRMKKGKHKPKVVEENTKAIERAFRIEKGTKYRFDVRSRQGKAASDWSPPVTVKG